MEYVEKSLNTTAEQFLNIENDQCDELSSLTLCEKVSFIYNPLDYAKETHEDYINKYCQGSKTVLFLGMNPGPYGMAQNGVPFGDSHYVKNWLKIEGTVSKPLKEHPRKTIEGLNCKRSEVSGSRFWSLLEDISKTPTEFFSQCFVHNYCPLVFLSETGKNITPPELPICNRKSLIDICDKALYEVITLLNVKFIIGIGKFAEVRANSVIKKYGCSSDIKVEGIMHPSPINPAANKGWKNMTHKKLIDLGVIDYLAAKM